MSEALLLLPHPDFKDLLANNKLLETYLAAYEQDEKNGHRQKTSSFLLFFFVNTFKGVITVDNCISFLKELKTQEKIDQNMLLETIFLIGYDIEKLDKTDKSMQEYRSNFLEFLKQIDAQGITDKELLIERLEEDYLDEAGMIDKKMFIRKRARINTKNHYEQQKYNLFREENEGYSKLIIDVLQHEFINSKDLPAMKNNVLSLVGYFDLDPNRVLDVVLDAYECYPDNLYYHEIILSFKKSAVPHLLGFKFSNYQKITSATTTCAPVEVAKCLTERGMTPYALFKITANLIKAGIIQIEDIWVHLSPTDDEMKTAFTDKFKTASTLFKKNYEKNLNASDEQKKKDRETELQNYASVESQFIYNQKIWLMETLVRNNSWLYFEKLFLSLNCVVDLTAHLPLLSAVSEFLEWIIEPVYRKISPTRFTKKAPKITNFPYADNYKDIQLGQIQKLDLAAFESILRVVKVLSSTIGKNVFVYTKLCRLIKHYLDNPSADEHEKIYKIIIYITTQILLPGVSLVKANPGVVATLWTILQDFDYSIRFKAYEDWMITLMYSKPCLMLEGYNTVKQVNPWFKTITVDTVKQKGRILGNISHNNPGLVFKQANYVIKNYSNLIEPIVNALSYSSNLSLDTIIFLILRDLSNPKYEDSASEQFLRDGTVSDTHGNFATFLGHFLRKYYTVDLTSIFSFLMNRILNKQYLDLIILREIISKMSGSETLEALNYNQLQALAGGIFLQIESAALTNDFKKAKKSSSSLKNFFFKKTLNYIPTSTGETMSFAFGLLVCLSVLRSKILFADDIEINLKLMMKLYDQVSDSIIHFTQFLRYHAKESSTLYSSILPKEALFRTILDYKIQPELAFHIIRPSIKAMHTMTPEERTELIELFQKSFDNFDPETMYKHKDPSMYAVITPEFVWKDIKTQVWKNITPELYTLFWALSLDMIYVPVERYDAEVQRLNEEISNLDKTGDQQKANKAKKEKNLERLQNSKENFESEKQKLLQNKDKIDKFIEERREFLFEGIGVKRINHVFIQVCLYPRLIFSPGDAIYAAKFVERWHKIRKISYTDFLYSTYNILTTILTCLQASTERETIHIGVFFTELFQLIASWYEESSLKQVVKAFNATEPFEFYKLQHIILTIFARMRGMLRSNLLSKEYVKAKNSILLLNKVIDIFPPVEEDAKVIRETIEKLQQNFTEEDIKKLGESYLGALKRKQDSLPAVDRTELKKRYQAKDKKMASNKSTSKERNEESKSNRKMETESDRKRDDDHRGDKKRNRDQMNATDKDRGEKGEFLNRHGTSSKKGDRDKDKDRDRSRQDADESFNNRELKKVKRDDNDKDRGDKDGNSKRDRSGDRDREKERDRDRERERDRDKEKEKDRDRERERDREKDRDKGKDRGNDSDHDKERERDREKDKERDRRGDNSNHQEKSKVISTSKKK